MPDWFGKKTNWNDLRRISTGLAVVGMGTGHSLVTLSASAELTMTIGEADEPQELTMDVQDAFTGWFGPITAACTDIPTFRSIVGGDLSAATTLPLAPVAQGDIIVADGTPEWSIQTLAAAAGYALISTATTAEWDQTPTWTGLHTFTGAPAIEIDVATGDPAIVFDTQGADKFIIGVDDDDSDKFKISGGGALGSNDWFEMDSAGALLLATGLGIGGVGAPVTGADLALSGHIRSLRGLIVGSVSGSPAGLGNVEITKSVGDPRIILDIAGSNLFCLGIDDTDDAFKISGGDTLGSSDYITCASSEVFLMENTDIDGVLTLQQQAEPSDPSEGAGVLWLSNGTGAGDAGDLMWKSTESAVTKTETLIDFSAI